MKEQNFDKSEQPGPFDLEQRLTTYYGPQLREQPLSQASWQHLRLQLGLQEGTRRRGRFHWRLPHSRSRAYVPTFIQEAFARIAYEARIPATQSIMLRCSQRPRRHEPAVRGSWLGRRKIWLLLPLNALITMGQAELDVLLATGLARSIGARKPAYTLGRLLLAGTLLIACVTLILFWLHHMPFVGFPVALLLCAGFLWLSHTQARSLAFHADTLIVLWLGRSRVCSGLHALADRSRTPGRRRWGEPSLAERIERVCGTRVETRSNQLTLVG
jgi:hypothetical protein